ncbi:MAG: iron-sulfur cluster assembly scaffold protein [Deltaproteobacteria bacterium]|nr:iron-sulfur cluster assembly scaffold protein [Candidatus Anaeroferrophillus wilburensis]MBN2890088.1 iron-sulfur cluster assembly scaffold protein [Deltaproteobacteria bacterium]
MDHQPRSYPPITAERQVSPSAAFSPLVIDYFQHPRNLGQMDKADGHAGGRGPCGDAMWMWLKISRRDTTEIITKATFVSDICIGALSCGSRLTEMVIGMDVQQAMQITPAALLAALDGLPEQEQHCAALAVKTLKETIRNYHENRAAGWKQLYRR